MNKEYLKKCLIFSFSILLTLIVAIIMSYMVYNFKSIKTVIGDTIYIFRPIIFGFIFAYLMRPICIFFEKRIKKIKKIKSQKVILYMSIFLTLLGVGLFLFALYAIIIPQLISSIPLLINSLSNYINGLYEKIESSNKQELKEIINYLSNNGISFDPSVWLNKYITPYITNIIGTITDSIFSILIVIKDILIGIIIAVYVLTHKTKLGKQAKLILYAILPKKFANICFDEIKFADNVFNDFLVGKVLDSLIIGIITYLSMLVLGLSFAPLIAVIVAVTNIIPVFGPFIGAVPSMIILLANDSIEALIFLVLIIIIQQLDGQIIGPKILGRATGISSFWILFSILIFGQYFGLLGMIIGIPLFAVIYDVVKRITYKILIFKKDKAMIDDYQEYKEKNNIK